MEEPGEQEVSECAICHDQLDGEKQDYKLQCNHCFHTECILGWFRRGAQTCPSCRDPGHIEATPIGALALRARANYFRRKVRANTKCCPKLKELVLRARKIDSDLAKIKKDSMDYKRENKETFKQFHLLRKRRWKVERKKSDAMKVLGLYTDSSNNLPSLLIDRNVNYW